MKYKTLSKRVDKIHDDLTNLFDNKFSVQISYDHYIKNTDIIKHFSILFILNENRYNNINILDELEIYGILKKHNLFYNSKVFDIDFIDVEYILNGMILINYSKKDFKEIETRSIKKFNKIGRK